jgi:hypothetical protein
MVVTYHAGERFLQRVFNFTNYSKKQVLNAMKLIQKDISNISTSQTRFVLPTFPDFLGVRVENKLVTIIPK